MHKPYSAQALQCTSPTAHKPYSAQALQCAGRLRYSRRGHNDLLQVSVGTRHTLIPTHTYVHIHAAKGRIHGTYRGCVLCSARRGMCGCVLCSARRGLCGCVLCSARRGMSGCVLRVVYAAARVLHATICVNACILVLSTPRRVCSARRGM